MAVRQIVMVFISVLLWRVDAVPAAENPPAAPTIVLNTQSYWRYFLTARKPVVVNGPKLTEMDNAGFTSALPPADWTKTDFNDQVWCRMRAPLFRGFEGGVEGAGYGLFKQNSSSTALVCLRGKFNVAEPQAAGDLSLTLAYRGGVVVYINGAEVGRANVPDAEKKGLEALADIYPDAAFLTAAGKPIAGNDIAKNPAALEARIRHLTALKVPASALRKGVNVLALEIHRTPFPQAYEAALSESVATLGWATAGLVSVELKAQSGVAAISTNVDRPRGVQVWARPASQRTGADEYGDANEPLYPIKLAGARNGAFIGQILVSADHALKGLKVELTALAGPGDIPAGNIDVRFGVADGQNGGMGLFDGGDREHPSFDTLETTLPQAPVARDGGAVQPIYLIVNVPRDAKAGDYKGAVAVSVEGGAAVNVPLEITVADWTIPDAKDFRTHVGLIESPDSVALHYDVEPWSQRHWQLLDQIFALTAQVGPGDLYIPLQAHLHMGNENSMVRWIRKDSGGYDLDFSIVEKYLDMATKRVGHPPVVCLWCWDKHNGLVYGKQDHPDKPSRFTVFDPKTGKTEMAEGPAFGTPEARAFWKPVFDGMRKVLKDRGLEKSMFIGIFGDSHPTKQAFDDLWAASDGTKWVYRGHPEPRGEMYGHPLAEWAGYYSYVYTHDLADPSVKRSYGWQADDILRTDFPRPGGMPDGNDLQNNTIPGRYRMYLEGVLTYGVRGIGQIGADFWPVLKQGGRHSSIISRYPDDNWIQLSIDASVTHLLSAGKDGPLSTVRFEMLREGSQECEARILLEKALLGPAQKARLGEDLAQRAQSLLDARQRAIMLCCEDWWFYTAWERRSGELFAVAAEASAKLSR